MTIFNKELFFKFKPDEEILLRNLEIQKKIGNLEAVSSKIFYNPWILAKTFSYIESKFSHKIEGIYTSLFDNVNTNQNKVKNKEIAPIITILLDLKKEYSTLALISSLERNINKEKDKTKRWKEEFGVYNSRNEKIYQPPTEEKVVKELLEEFFKKIKKDRNIYDFIISHILFEKIHPFVDANGRIGRLIFHKQMKKIYSFNKIIPISCFIFKNNSQYYKLLDLKDNNLKKSILMFFDIIDEAIATTINFIEDLNNFNKKYKDKILDISSKITKKMEEEILLSLQVKRESFERRYNLNPRTIDRIFEEINNLGLAFNIKTVNKKKIYWNIELEDIIEKHYR